MSKPSLHTALSPKLFSLYDVKDTIVVVIDVFRATSTIATALYNGAKKIIPVDNVAKCIEIGQKTGGITAGERDGKVIEGLQYGNSPSEYPKEFINGKILVLTTTNGTKLIHKAVDKNATEIITGSFNNMAIVCDFLLKQNKNVLLACSGWKDRFNLEDTLFAGAVISKVKQHFTIHCDASLMAEQMYAQHAGNMKSFIRQTTHWHRLAEYGLEYDLEYCVQEDVAPVLPYFQNSELVHKKF